MDYRLTLEQKQQLSQHQIQSLEILTMDSATLNEFVQKEYLENPILEHQPSAGEREAAPAGAEDNWELPVSLKLYKAVADATVTYTGSRPADEDERSFEIPDQREEPIGKYILNQIPAGRYSQKEMALIDYLIQSLDQNGYFTGSAAETAQINGVPEEMVERCLADLRQLEPCGIFAAGLKECLLCQLEQMGVSDEVLIRMVKDHLEDIAAGRISSITRALKISTSAARQYIVVIKKLNPRPLSGFPSGQTEYVVPDIILRRQDGQWEITLNDKWIGDYRISDYYLRMMEETQDEELREYFRTKLERARMILKNIEQRRNTVTSITKAVLEWQMDYFTGEGPLKPMTMAEIAERIHMHTSTVSRGVRGKYIQTPKETLLFKNLFSQAVSSAEEEKGGVTSAEIKKQLKEIVAAENPARPLSDQAIVKALEAEGISISRRTVAKYRDELHILGSFQRKV